MKPLSSLTLDTPTGKLLQTLLLQNISLYAAHTNLDRADGGLNDRLAARLGLVDVRPLTDGEPLVKIAVTVPPGHADALIEAMATAGAGRIGDYRRCAFRLEGEGQFEPLVGATPFVGTVGVLETLTEARVEMVVPASRRRAVEQALRSAHPYETPAFDVYPLSNTSASGALGRVGRLPSPMPLAEWGRTVMKVLGAKWVRTVGAPEAKLATVACCGGSGADLWPLAQARGADVLVTGDVKHHTALDAEAAGMCLVDAGHVATELVGLEVLAEILESSGVTVEKMPSADPFHVFVES